MNIAEIVQSSGWKNFMAKLYGIGAAVVIIGALFKIMHWPGASLMITLGLGTEAIIFFFSAFEPLHEELDWTLVYPELADLSDEDDLDQIKEESLAGRGGVGLQKFDELIKDANIQPETIKSLSKGLTSLSETSGNLSRISEASIATTDYLSNMKAAAAAVNSVATSYASNSDHLNESVNSLASSYKKTADVLNKSGEDIAQKFVQQSSELSNSYKELTNTVKADYTNISQGHKEFGAQLAGLNKNLSELNSAYESQISGSKEHLKGNDAVYKELSTMMKDLKSSVEETQKYKEEISKLSQNLSELNNIYGNMLSAMTIVKK
ncbi:MAG: gliding motility protein GldL [Bacteroidales bacterium]|nr:gliding motility protein GldL [Bacteroidales bacterium]MCF8389210.1 gliding motility protein GldL [Bacteroidales bacterium]